jgi:hypothetical protein
LLHGLANAQSQEQSLAAEAQDLRSRAAMTPIDVTLRTRPRTWSWWTVSGAWHHAGTMLVTAAAATILGAAALLPLAAVLIVAWRVRRAIRRRWHERGTGR